MPTTVRPLSRFILRRVTSAAIAISLVACGDDATDPGNAEFMTALIDGQSWTATQSLSASYGIPGSDDPGLVIIGTDALGRDIAVSSDAAHGIGTFSIHGTSSSAIGLVEASGLTWHTFDLFSGKTGELRITAFNTTAVAGTFSFTTVASPLGQQPRVVTQGAFNIRF